MTTPAWETKDRPVGNINERHGPLLGYEVRAGHHRMWSWRRQGREAVPPRAAVPLVDLAREKRTQALTVSRTELHSQAWARKLCRMITLAATRYSFRRRELWASLFPLPSTSARASGRRLLGRPPTHLVEENQVERRGNPSEPLITPMSTPAGPSACGPLGDPSCFERRRMCR